MAAEQQYSDFKAELIRIGNQLFPERNGIEFDEGTHPDTKEQFVFFFPFWSDEEDKVDLFIRTVRNELLSISQLSEQNDSNLFVYEVWKSAHQSCDNWDVTFSLALEYKFTENVQP